MFRSRGNRILVEHTTGEGGGAESRHLLGRARMCRGRRLRARRWWRRRHGYFVCRQGRYPARRPARIDDRSVTVMIRFDVPGDNRVLRRRRGRRGQGESPATAGHFHRRNARLDGGGVPARMDASRSGTAPLRRARILFVVAAPALDAEARRTSSADAIRYVSGDATARLPPTTETKSPPNSSRNCSPGPTRLVARRYRVLDEDGRDGSRSVVGVGVHAAGSSRRTVE